MFAVVYPGVVLQLQVSQSTGEDLVAFRVHPADLPREFQQYFKFDRPSSLIQQEKPPGRKCTLAQGLVITRASVNGKPESENATVFLAKRGVMVPGVSCVDCGNWG